MLRLFCRRPTVSLFRSVQWTGKGRTEFTGNEAEQIVGRNIKRADRMPNRFVLNKENSEKEKLLERKRAKYEEATNISIMDIQRNIKPYREVNETEELRKLWQLQNLATIRRFNFKIPENEQKTVRVALIGRTNSGKSTLINKLVGRSACPVADFNDVTHRTSIHSVQKGNIIYEFVDLPGVPDTISPDGVGEYTFRRKNILKAKRNKFGNHSLFNADNANFATNDLFIKNCDVVLVCADLTSRMTVAGNLTVNVYQLLKRNPHVPSMLVLTKSDHLKYRTNYKFQNLERKNARMLKLMDIIDKMTEGHLGGTLTDAGKARFLQKHENVIQMKPTTVQIEESGLEMRRPMRIRRITAVRQIESILRLTNSWRWNDLNQYQQRLYNMGNRGWRYFESIFPVSMELPQTIDPIFERLGEKALNRPWEPERLLEGQLDPHELLEENLRMSCLKHLRGKSAHAAETEIKHLEVNGTPSNAQIRVAVDISYDLKQPRFMNARNPGDTYQLRLDTKYCEKHFEKNMIKIRSTMEGKVKSAFNVQNCEINLNLVRLGDLNEPIVEIAPQMENVPDPINESFKNSFADDPKIEKFDPERFIQSSFDYHFLNEETKEFFFKKRPIGRKKKEVMGILQKEDQIRIQRIREKLNRKYGRLGDHDKFRRKDYDSDQ